MSGYVLVYETPDDDGNVVVGSVSRHPTIGAARIAAVSRLMSMFNVRADVEEAVNMQLVPDAGPATLTAADIGVSVAAGSVTLLRGEDWDAEEEL